MTSRHCFFIILILFGGLGARGWADDVPTDWGIFETPVKTTDIDPKTFAEWFDGSEKSIPDPAVTTDTRAPNFALWAQDHLTGNRSLAFGYSKTPGPRYLRIGFINKVPVGGILALGNVTVSVLKPGAAYPGNLSDDSQWVTGTRIEAGKVTSDQPKDPHEDSLWVFPPGTVTRALRFSHVAQPNDMTYQGMLSSAFVLSARVTNIAPEAIAATSSSPEKANRINDGVQSRAALWDNIAGRDGVRAEVVSAQSPEWVMLIWPKPVTLRGLGFLIPGFNTADVQIYTGPETTHPRDAAESDWQTLATTSIPLSEALCTLEAGFSWLDFGKDVTTRAVRLRITQPIPEKNLGWHWTGDGLHETRVWLSEMLALQSLGEQPLTAPAAAPAGETQAHPPIPIHFSLPEGGNVTLVIEDSTGKRVRNLVSDTPFPKGDNTAWWDGTDDLGRDVDAVNHGIYFIPPEFVPPGAYAVRGLWHKPLDLHYEFSVYYPGDPPWPTVDNTGGWMTSHTPASCVIFIPPDKAPGGQPLVGVGAFVSEGGSAFSWVNLDGRKVGGRGWIGGTWTGAQYLAGDPGPKPEPGVSVYVGSTALGNKRYGVNGKVEIRLTKLTTLVPAGDKPVLKDEILLDAPPPPAPGMPAPSTEDYLGGLAVYNGLMVISETAFNKLVFIDCAAGTVIGEAPLTDPRALVFDAQGRLLVLSGKTLVRYPAGATAPTLPTPETLVTGLEDPRGITVDSTGKIYIADQGNSQQVKTFSPDGKPSLVYGHPGPPKAGPYDPLHMNHPKGIAVDSNGRLWVAENDFQPKRVSVWNTDGTLWKDYLGPPQYGGGGIIDSHQKGAFLYNGMEFQLDWDKGTYQLSRIFYRMDATDFPLGFRSAPPESPIYFNGKRYLSDVYNSNATSAASSAFLFLDKGDGGAVVPVASAGSAYSWPILQTDPFKSCWPQGVDPAGNAFKTPAFYLWSDLNGDGEVQPDEVKIIAGINGGITVGDDGSFLISWLGPDPTHLNATRFKPTRFTDQGVPVYDIAAGETLAPSQPAAADGHGQVLTGSDGWLVMTTPPPPFSKLGVGGAKNGTPSWSYPSLWPGLHPSHSAPIPSEPGMIIGSTRLLGGLISPKGSESGPLFFLNSNQGDVYAFTQDGLFVAQLFQDFRQGAGWEMPSAVRNMRMNDLSLGGENFFPSVAATSEGQVYLASGALMGIIRVDGLDTIRMIAPSPLQVTAGQLKQAQDFVVAREAARQAEQGTGVLSVPILDTPPTVDGNLDDWKDAQWVPIDHRGTAAWFDSHTKPFAVDGTVAVSGPNLYAAWKTGDPRLLLNAGDIPNALFKSGGALDLMIGADPSAKPNRPAPVPGDERLLISQVDGKTKALLYRAVVPGTADKDKVPFNAPWHGITLDRVDDVSDQVQLAGDKDGDYEISVPLALLGLKPVAGTRIKGDIGILRGDGRQTTQRVYWANKATAMVSDVPSEAELTPSLWGSWEFDQK